MLQGQAVRNATAMAEIMAAVAEETECGQEVIEVAEGLLKRCMLYGPSKLYKSLCAGEGDMRAKLWEMLVEKAFASEEGEAGIVATGFLATLEEAVSQYCDAKSVESGAVPAPAGEAMRGPITSGPVPGPPGGWDAFANQSLSPVPGKRKQDPALLDVKPKIVLPHHLDALPKHLLAAAEDLKAGLVGRPAKKQFLTEYEMRPFMIQLQQFCLESGILFVESQRVS